MGNEGALRACMVGLAVMIAVVGLWTHSFRKMALTYFTGMLAIAGVLLPDWEYFDRDVSQWLRPILVDHIKPGDVHRHASSRFRFYPIRTVVYATIYGLGTYKWWKYVTDST